MKKIVFDYSDYKQYLEEWLQSQEKSGRGKRSAMAQVMGCQTAYVSQVLKANAQFSLEQAQMLSQFLAHSREEEDYFLLLVQFARAGTKDLQEHFHLKITEIHARRQVLKERLGVKQELSPEDQARYYSAWHYGAIHVLVTIPEFQEKSAIVKRLRLSSRIVNDALDFLTRSGLILQEGDRYTIGTARLHLGNDSPFILQHHSNWRMRAVLGLEREGEGDLHYSSAVTLARADIVKIREVLVRAIETVKPLIRDSKEEELYSFCVDWFRV